MFNIGPATLNINVSGGESSVSAELTKTPDDTYLFACTLWQRDEDGLYTNQVGAFNLELSQKRMGQLVAQPGYELELDQAAPDARVRHIGDVENPWV